jgi:hypothetical protein
MPRECRLLFVEKGLCREMRRITFLDEALVLRVAGRKALPTAVSRQHL